MKVYQQNREVPFRQLDGVPGVEELASTVRGAFDLLSPQALVSEKVFIGTHRLIAMNPSIKMYSVDTHNATYGNRAQELLDIVEPQVEWLRGFYPTACPLLVQVATLPPQATLLWHIDSYIYQSLSHKVHIPIITNPGATYNYMLGRRACSKHFAIGTAYEINNMFMHRATNNGPTPRSHIIIDFLEEEGYALLDQGVNVITTYHAGNKQTEIDYWK